MQEPVRNAQDLASKRQLLGKAARKASSYFLLLAADKEAESSKFIKNIEQCKTPKAKSNTSVKTITSQTKADSRDTSNGATTSWT